MPYHLNVQDPVKDFLDPAIKGTTGLLKSIKENAPTVKRVVLTSSSAAVLTPMNHAKIYDETCGSPFKVCAGSVICLSRRQMAQSRIYSMPINENANLET